MTILSEVIRCYEAGAHTWIQNAYGDTSAGRGDHPDRTPRFCPVGALWEIGGYTPASEDAERALHDAAALLGYPTFYRYNDAADRTLDEVLEFMRAVDFAVSEGLT